MWTLRPLPFDDLAGWAADDHAAALRAFSRHADRPAGEAYRHGRLGIPPESLEPLFAEAAQDAARKDPRGFFESHFDCHALTGSNGERGFVTAFYEPEIAASRRRTDRFRVPFHRRPDDLVTLRDDNRPTGWDKDMRFARRMPDGVLMPYPDRKAINAGFLEGRGLEIAYVEHAADAFFAHVQGAARLRLDDGTSLRVTFDGKTGHPFTAIGKLLVQRGEIAADAVSMTTIRAWLSAHPDDAQALMEENRSYIFFRETPVGDAADGPVAAAKVPLTAERSLAVDRLLYSFGTPVFVSADSVNGKTWSKLMIAQETGSAMIGPARGDLFMGSGDAAGERASAVRSAADFTVLMPKSVQIDREKAVAP
ncbi:MltA domain-containing protein [Oricola sp.]|uniref:murein transglycosylase A n=1 Tax=Oricola sp. TaxID=1979950 RepID=UPI0025E6DAAA|nr:MltA domain-containing protein [Oricola sp.]MCI5077531.1 MltA domain-containing protein [Oricola sp.]